MNKKFTLIELLVVISTIALLLSILMPSLSIAKEKARGVVCQGNLRGWGQIVTMFTLDNDGKFWDGWRGADEPEGLWPRALEPYYGDKDFRLCPSAKKLSTGNGRGSTNQAWDARSADWVGPEGIDDYGSYGLNGWIPAERDQMTWNGQAYKEDYWAKMDAKGASRIPLFMDAIWWKAYPRNTDLPPSEQDGGNAQDMSLCCIPRHGEEINTVFMDLSIRKVGLKELWKFIHQMSFLIRSSCFRRNKD